MLSKLIKAAPKQTATVPEWLIGLWKREYIFDSDGTMDEYSDGTKVVYMQTPSTYIDFRIPASIIDDRKSFITSNQTLSNPFNNYSQELYYELANQLCDSGHCVVSYKQKMDGIKLSDLVHQGHDILTNERTQNVDDFFSFPVAKWIADINYQLNTTYPEPGILTQHESRKDCFYEQPPSNQYLELWHHQSDSNGPCIYLELVKETVIDDENTIHRRNGRMIIMGRYIMMVRDRKQSKEELIKKFDVNDGDLRTVMKSANDLQFCKEILDAEYSFGRIVNDNHLKESDLECISSMQFEVELSSIPFYVGRRINVFDEGNWNMVDGQYLIETDHEMQVKRYWKIKHFDIQHNKIFTA